MVDQPRAHDPVRAADTGRRPAPCGRRLPRPADRRRGRTRLAARRLRPHPGAAPRARRGRPRHHPARCAARHQRRAVAAARPARPARQRDDPREGADARAHALRGLRVLRQADARAPRGLEPPAVAGRSHLRARSRTCISLVSFGALLAAFSPWAVADPRARRAARRSSPRPSSPATPSACSAGARPRRACRSTSRRRSRARTTPRRSSCSASARCSSSATARSSATLYGEDRELTLRRGAWGFGLGLLGTAALLRRLRLDRRSPRCAARSRSAR